MWPAVLGEDNVDTLHAFNEATGLWEDLPPMPHACANAGHRASSATSCSSRVGLASVTNIYRLYRFMTLPPERGVWGTPQATRSGCGVVTDGTVISGRVEIFGFSKYDGVDVQSNTWTEHRRALRIKMRTGPRPQGYPEAAGTEPRRRMYCDDAFAHNGRIVTVNMNRTAFQWEAAVPAWSRFDLDGVRAGKMQLPAPLSSASEWLHCRP